MTQPIGWEPVTGQHFLSFLHPPVKCTALADIYVGAGTYQGGEPVSGVLFAREGDELTVTSCGNMVVRVANEDRAHSYLFQLSELTGKMAPADEDPDDWRDAPPAG